MEYVLVSETKGVFNRWNQPSENFIIDGLGMSRVGSWLGEGGEGLTAVVEQFTRFDACKRYGVDTVVQNVEDERYPVPSRTSGWAYV